MGELGERRKGRRVRLPERPGGRIRATLSARLLDLSTTGARIEHHNMLRPGFTCTSELPAIMGALILPARVVRSTVVGTEVGPTGERLLQYESGVAFGELTVDQQTALETVLGKLAPGDPLGHGRLVL
jgi:hypothetical protein